MKKILGSIVFLLMTNAFASSFSIFDLIKQTAKEFPSQTETAEVNVPLYAEPSASTCKAWETKAGGNSVNPGVTCNQVMELPVGSKLNYTGNFISFAAASTSFFNPPARGFVSFEVSYVTPNRQTGVAYIRAIEKSKLWGSSLSQLAAHGFQIQLPEVVKGAF